MQVGIRIMCIEGFVLNGVDRGGGFNGYGRHDKCSYRDGAGRITRVLSSLGFRWGVNGVYHGDGANPKDVTYWGRCSARSSAILRNRGHEYIGFHV